MRRAQSLLHTNRIRKENGKETPFSRASVLDLAPSRTKNRILAGNLLTYFLHPHPTPPLTPFRAKEVSYQAEVKGGLHLNKGPATGSSFSVNIYTRVLERINICGMLWVLGAEGGHIYFLL